MPSITCTLGLIPVKIVNNQSSLVLIFDSLLKKGPKSP